MQLTISTENAGQRLDMYLTEHFQTLSRSFIRQLLDDGKMLVNGSQVKAGYKLKVGDKLDLNFDPAALAVIPSIDLKILYEDDDCMVIEKPAGILTHSKGAFNPEATVATFIEPHLSKLSGERGGIVHRLDRATSGVIICAKTPGAMTWLQKQFSQRKVKKTYYAVIEGTLDPPAAIIEIPIERNPNDPKSFRGGEGGKVAVTQYEVVQTGREYSLVELHPTTGRTHQLRVHLRYISHPIVGDPLYEGKPADRMYLHAERLELTLPNRQRKVFESPLPASFHAILKA